MIKVKNRRYNPMDFRSYYPYINPNNQPCIAIEWIDKDTKDTVILFANKEERDNVLKAWDEALLIVDDEKVLRGTPLDLPFLIDEGGLGGMGGINLQ